MSAQHWLTVQAIQYRCPVRKRIVLMKCPTCGKEWDVALRGRETGFIVSAANNHAFSCARLAQEQARG